MIFQPSIGSPLEVRFPTPDGDVWLPATTQYVDDKSIVAVFSDGDRFALPRGQGLVRTLAQWRYAAT